MRFRFSFLAAVVTALLLVCGSRLNAAPASPAPATATPVAASIGQARIDTMLRTGHADPAWFSSVFLAEISPAMLEAGLASLTPMLGQYLSLTPAADPGHFVVQFSKGTAEAYIHFDSQGKIDGLRITKPHLAVASLDDALKTLADVPGTVSYIVEDARGTARASRQPDDPLAVGSAFKLAVLNALADEIRRSRRHWSDVVPLAAQWKSLPSGVLQNWPAGTPITISTYATEMISISDNTAADSLIHIAGQGALAPYAESNKPFLTTREMFTLKSTEGDRFRGMYLTVDSASGRASVLRQVDALPLPPLDTFETKPNLGVEWHYSARDLCRLMWKVASLPLMSVNPGVADAKDFSHVAYKGGSDAGVLNLTTAVTTRRGMRLCFSATVNATTAIDETTFELRYGAALRTLAGL
jgi:beta-lactamase class A